jgi:hypothetical protein
VTSGSALAARLPDFDTPDAVVNERLAIAAEVAAEEPVACALVVGSTALRRCSPRADLDLVLVTAGARPRFESRIDNGVRVEIERLEPEDALAITTGHGWVWELRNAARLGCSMAVVDTDGFAARLSRQAEAMAPWADRVEATLRDVYLRLVDLGRGAGGMESLRGCLDNVALLALLERPRRYLKPKWVIADLLHAGELHLVDALLAAYGIATSGPDKVAGAHDVIRRIYASAGLPAHEQLLAMGHTEELAEASYVSRCLDDADDLAASGRHVEAQYVALFSARLARELTSDLGDDVGRRYSELFPAEGHPDDELLASVLAATDARRAA